MKPSAYEETQTTRVGIIDDATCLASFCFDPWRSTHKFRWLIFVLAVTGGCTLGAALTAILAPGMRAVLLREDGIIEMASAICLAAVVLGVGLAAAVWGVCPPLLLGGLIGLAELMDETSFGARILGFQPPALYGGGEFDGFHDLLILAYRLLREVRPSLGWIWLTLILVASVGIMLFALREIWNQIGGAGSWLASHVLLLVHIGFIGLAQVIDVATSSKAVSAMEEMLELDAALVLLFYVVQQARNSRSLRRRGKDRGRSDIAFVPNGSRSN